MRYIEFETIKDATDDYAYTLRVCRPGDNYSGIGSLNNETEANLVRRTLQAAVDNDAALAAAWERYLG